jgi:hypothetical protein
VALDDERAGPNIDPVSTFPFEDRPEARDALVDRDATGASDGLALFARLEGLMGEERALLSIPRHERTREHADRLRVVSEELDRIWDRLRARAVRLGLARDSSGPR